MNAEDWDPFDRSDAPFLEWLLSDHPAAGRERRRRRVECTAWWAAERRDAWAFVHRIEDDPEASEDLRAQVAAVRSIIARADLRAEIEDAFDDALQVFEDRRHWEIHIQATHGDPTYTYPRRYLGVDAADCPPLI